MTEKPSPKRVIKIIDRISKTEGFKSALRYTILAIRRMPNNRSLYLERAKLERAVHGSAAAIPTYKSMTRLWPNDPIILFELARAIWDAGVDDGRALRVARSSLRILPDNADCILLYISIVRKVEGEHAALKVSEQAVSFASKKWAFVLQHGNLLRIVKGDTIAADWFELSAHQNTVDLRKLLQAASILRDLGKKESSVQIIMRILKDNPLHYPSIDLLANIYHEANDDTAALEVLTRAITLARHVGDKDKELKLLIRAASIYSRALDLQHIADVACEVPDIKDSTAAQTIVLLERNGRHDLAKSFTRHLLATKKIRSKVAYILLARWAASMGRDGVCKISQGILNACAPSSVGAVRVHLSYILHGPHEALREARVTYRRKSRTSREIAEISELVFQTGRVQVGIRYLRRAMKYHPTSYKITSIYTLSCARYGFQSDARKALKQAELRCTFSREQVHHLRCRLELICGNRKPYAEMVTEKFLRNVKLSNIDLQIALLSGHFDGLSKVRDAMAERSLELSREARHFSPTVAGSILNEIIITSKYECDHPHTKSTAAAVSIIDRWKGENHHPINPPPNSIRPIIVQYWSQGQPDSFLLSVMDSWRSLDDFRYTLFNKQMASKFITENFGNDWGHAFRKARNIAEESDFFRLCYISKSGGIYIDADDRCIVNPCEIISRSLNLLVYQETSGAIGNNFIAAKPLHPAILSAAIQAKNSLLNRESDSTWSKTGPGLLTRTISEFLTQGGNNPEISIVHQHQISPFIQMHVKLPYKRTNLYWNSAARRDANGLVGAIANELGSGLR